MPRTGREGPHGRDRSSVTGVTQTPLTEEPPRQSRVGLRDYRQRDRIPRAPADAPPNPTLRSEAVAGYGSEWKVRPLGMM